MPDRDEPEQNYGQERLSRAGIPFDIAYEVIARIELLDTEIDFFRDQRVIKERHKLGNLRSN